MTKVGKHGRNLVQKALDEALADLARCETGCKWAQSELDKATARLKEKREQIAEYRALLEGDARPVIKLSEARTGKPC
jgi:hypothetical protein